MSIKTFESVYAASIRMNMPFDKLTKTSKKYVIQPSQKAKILETFICKKNNQLTRIAKLTGESYYRVFKIIEAHMNDLRLQKNDDSDCNFITLESKINKIQ